MDWRFGVSHSSLRVLLRPWGFVRKDDLPITLEASLARAIAVQGSSSIFQVARLPRSFPHGLQLSLGRLLPSRACFRFTGANRLTPSSFRRHTSSQLTSALVHFFLIGPCLKNPTLLSSRVFRSRLARGGKCFFQIKDFAQIEQPPHAFCQLLRRLHNHFLFHFVLSAPRHRRACISDN